MLEFNWPEKLCKAASQLIGAGFVQGRAEPLAPLPSRQDLRVLGLGGLRLRGLVSSSICAQLMGILFLSGWRWFVWGQNQKNQKWDGRWFLIPGNWLVPPFLLIPWGTWDIQSMGHRFSRKVWNRHDPKASGLVRNQHIRVANCVCSPNQPRTGSFFSSVV